MTTTLAHTPVRASWGGGVERLTFRELKDFLGDAALQPSLQRSGSPRSIYDNTERHWNAAGSGENGADPRPVGQTGRQGAQLDLRDRAASSDARPGVGPV